GYKVEVSNNTRFKLTDCAVSFKGHVASAGDLAPGESKSVDFRDVSGEETGKIGPVAVNSDSSGTPGAADIKRAMAQAVTSNEVGLQGNSPFLFTGWFSDPVSGLGLENEHPTIE